VIRACDVGVCSSWLTPAVLHAWREPKHSVFEDGNVWSPFNSFTEALKEGSLNELPKRTEALHGLLDVAVGLNGKRSAFPSIGNAFLLHGLLQSIT
jgi:hypothetical protein